MTKTSDYLFTSIRTGRAVIISAVDMDSAWRKLPADFDKSYGTDAYRIPAN